MDPKTKAPRRLGLKFQLLILLFALNLIAACAYTAVLYSVHRVEIIAGIDNQLKVAVNAVQEIIPSGYHEHVFAAHDAAPDAYDGLLARLSQFANDSGLVYVYTYMKFGDEIRVVSTSATPQEIRNGEQTPFFSLYETAPQRLYETFADRKVRYDEYSDSFGRFRSIYVPMQDEGGQVYVIGADVDLGELNERIVLALLKSISIGIAMFGLSMVVGWVLVARIVRPLMSLTAFTQSMADHNFEPDEVELSAVEDIGASRGDEVGRLADAMTAMISRLKRYLIEMEAATAARERVEGELSAAHDIQIGMLPRTFPAFPERNDVDVYAFLEPAKQVGGDLYDFFFIDAHRLFFVIGDVSGKGVPAALFMAMTKTLFQAQALSSASTAEIMARVNKGLARDNAGQLFVTAFAGILDLRSGEVEYSDGGHEPPFIIRADGHIERLEKEGGMALGMFDEAPYSSARFTLAPGEALILFTDGITEAENTDKTMYTARRIEEALGNFGGRSSARAIADGLVGDVRGFVGGAPQFDDIAVLVVCFEGQPAQAAVEAVAS